MVRAPHPVDTAVAAADTGGGPAIRIEVRDLVKRYRRAGGSEVVPVDHVSLTVRANEMVVLLGPSGCGKTTLLRCVAGLERPEAGEITIGEEPVFSSHRNLFLPANRRRASMIFQSYALFPHMNLFENVAYPLRSRGVRGGAVRDKVHQILELVGLSGLERSHPAQISGGQQQRVALARAIVAGTDVVLFDEPLSNVDAKVREQLRGELLNMQRELGFSGLYVTHDQTEAMAVADRIAVLSQGRIAQLDTPQNIYDHPASRYVGTFIGAANTWDGVLVEVGEGVATVRTELGPVRADAGAGATRVAGDPVVLLSRPENTRLSRQEPAGPNRWRVRVRTREFLGSHTEYLVTAGDTPIRVWSSDRAPIAEGDQVWLSLPPAAVRLLPDEPGAPAEGRPA